jgi:transposase-like protein
MQLVEDRSAHTLIPLIQEWCIPGTTIHSDGWAAYDSLSEFDFKHEVVIHEKHFKDPVTGVHTNAVENYWHRCKRRLRRVSGVVRRILPSYLDEFMWLERFGKTFILRWENTMMHIGINRE